MFDFFCVPRISFGRGKIEALPELMGPLGTQVLAVHNGGDGPLEKVREALRTTHVQLTPFRQAGEPTVASVDAALELARSTACTGVIGVGGGSAIDAAKAVAGLLANGGSALDYMEVIGRGQKITKLALPWIAIPTTAGTGAEVTRNAVIGEPSKKFKASIRSELLMARAAVVDPDLGVDVPPSVTAASGMDALCQCIEAYLSLKANALTDDLAIRGVSLAMNHLPAAFADGGDLTARERMASVALWSGICLTNAGLGAVHGIAAPLGAMFPVPHGVACAALLPGVLRANAKALNGVSDPAAAAKRRKFAQLATAAGVGIGSLPGDAVEQFIDAVAGLTRQLKIPNLGSFGVRDEHIPQIVAAAREASSMKSNPVVLSDDALTGALREAI